MNTMGLGHGRARAVAGLVDAAAASSGTFAASLAATRLLNADELGAYALLLGASMVAAVVLDN